MFLVFLILFFGIPIVAAVVFACQMIGYRRRKKSGQLVPGSGEEKKARLIVIISGVVAGVLLLAVLVCITLFFLAIAFM